MSLLLYQEVPTILPSTKLMDLVRRRILLGILSLIDLTMTIWQCLVMYVKLLMILIQMSHESWLSSLFFIVLFIFRDFSLTSHLTLHVTCFTCLGRELMHLQGLQLGRELTEKLTESQMVDLAGNGYLDLNYASCAYWINSGRTFW